MKYFIVEASDDTSREDITAAFYFAMDREIQIGYKEVREIPETTHRANGTPRMTFAQREKLWALCGGYNVPFQEDDYYIESDTGFVLGWIGGFNHSDLPSAKEKKTLYVGVEKNGNAHS